MKLLVILFLNKEREMKRGRKKFVPLKISFLVTLSKEESRKTVITGMLVMPLHTIAVFITLSHLTGSTQGGFRHKSLYTMRFYIAFIRYVSIKLTLYRSV